MATRQQDPQNSGRPYSDASSDSALGGRDVATGRQSTSLPESGEQRRFYGDRGPGFYRAAVERLSSPSSRGEVRSYGYSGYDRDIGGMQTYPSDEARYRGTEERYRGPARQDERTYGQERGWSGRSSEAYENRDESRRQEAYGRGRKFWSRESLTVNDVMTQRVKSVRREQTLRDVAQIMRDENCGIVPVVDNNGLLLGVVTDRDLVMRTMDEERPWTQIRVESVMTNEVDAATPNETVREVIELMGHKQIRRVPVVDRNDRLLGMLSMADIATRADADEELQDALERISSRRSFWSRLFGY